MRLQTRSLLHPTFRQRLVDLEGELARADIPLALYEGARTPFRQAELYARGRNIPGTKKVTNAKAWQSFHNYGLAADLVFYVDGKWTWVEPEQGQWKRYQEIAGSLGFVTLSFEMPHIQFPWRLEELRTGAFPPDGDQSWMEWLGHQIEVWGSFERDVAGAFHPPAPPPFDMDRPSIETS